MHSSQRSGLPAINSVIPINEQKNNFKWAEYIFIFSFMVLIVSLSFVVLPFSLLLITLIPLPILIATYRYNNLLAAVVAALVSIFFALFLQDSTMVILVLSMSTVGIGVGNAMKEKLPYRKVLIIGIVSSLITISLLGLGLSLVTGQSIKLLYKETTEKMLQELASVQPTNQAMLEQAQATINLFNILFPSMLFTGAVAIAGINVMAGSFVLKKLGLEEIPSLPPISNWAFPSWLSIAYFILWPLTLLNVFPDIVSIVISNLHHAVRWFLVIQGLSVIIYFLKTVRMPKWIKIIILLPVYFFSGWFLALLGALDPWLKYRGRLRLYQEELKKDKKGPDKQE